MLEDLIRERGDLVDKKYLTGLNTEEKTRLTELDRLLDEENEPFYKSAIERLRALINRRIPKE